MKGRAHTEHLDDRYLAGSWATQAGRVKIRPRPVRLPDEVNLLASDLGRADTSYEPSCVSKTHRARHSRAPDHGERVMGLCHLLPPFVEALQEGVLGIKWR